MIRLAISGAMGRMGRTVGRLALSDKNFKLAEALDAEASDADYGAILGQAPAGLTVATSLKKRVDALVDFSVPEGTMQRLDECVKTKSGLVVCTTGLEDKHRKKIQDAGSKIPVLIASNTSIGVTALLKTVADLAKMLGPEYDIEIVEMHHRLKKDAPSGTAISLAQAVAAATGRKYPDDFNFGRKGMVGERTKREIGMHALRGGGVVGDHDVIFASDHEVVTVSHRAGSRDLFAKGALRAAAFIAAAKPGSYSMADVLSQPPPA